MTELAQGGSPEAATRVMDVRAWAAEFYAVLGAYGRGMAAITAASRSIRSRSAKGYR